MGPGVQTYTRREHHIKNAKFLEPNSKCKLKYFCAVHASDVGCTFKKECHLPTRKKTCEGTLFQKFSMLTLARTDWKHATRSTTLEALNYSN
eukprot:gnl/TRDRNA2_/TRDRNA2_31779_c0_seq1.p1 gnl/TRDRNA2_/TRDRNA2_31779_c0~~gnl/TRDRNA2_/TRDRNA2_31779_c0_seq1.p1  ORF type:complete len:101 (-),score=2.25 gnl/TRDRNA2_/TRDRNA2_31779_c0_seq1:15-290(-)